MNSPPAKKKRKRYSSPSRPRVNDFQKNDLELLESGMLADGTIKCQGRTWKVHCVLLSSRLKWFKSAFCGSFAEATSKEVGFPEATPESVDIMIRHLYSEEIDVETLNTPLLCVCVWRMADYVQLDTLKSVAASALQEHLNAMLVLASSDTQITKIKPIWFTHFMDAFREVCSQSILRPLQIEFVTFLWIARFEMLGLSEIWEILDNHKRVRTGLHRLLIWHWFPDNSHKPLLVPWNWVDIETEIHTKQDFRWGGKERCSYCDKERVSGGDSNTDETVPEEPWFYNPLPMYSGTKEYHHAKIGDMKWCKLCAGDIIDARGWPWRPEDEPSQKRLHPKAWCWTDGNHRSE